MSQQRRMHEIQAACVARSQFGPCKAEVSLQFSVSLADQACSNTPVQTWSGRCGLF